LPVFKFFRPPRVRLIFFSPSCLKIELSLFPFSRLPHFFFRVNASWRTFFTPLSSEASALVSFQTGFLSPFCSGHPLYEYYSPNRQVSVLYPTFSSPLCQALPGSSPPKNLGPPGSNNGHVFPLGSPRSVLVFFGN